MVGVVVECFRPIFLLLLLLLLLLWLLVVGCWLLYTLSFGHCLGGSWAGLGESWESFGASWEHLGGVVGGRGSVLACVGSILEGWWSRFRTRVERGFDDLDRLREVLQGFLSLGLISG